MPKFTVIILFYFSSTNSINPWKAMNQTKRSESGVWLVHAAQWGWWIGGLWAQSAPLPRTNSIQWISSIHLISCCLLLSCLCWNANKKTSEPFNLIFTLIYQFFIFTIFLASKQTKQRERVGFPLFVGCCGGVWVGCLLLAG